VTKLLTLQNIQNYQIEAFQSNTHYKTSLIVRF